MGQAIKKNKVEYIDKVHGNSKGWITRSCIDENGYSQWHYKYKELKETDLTEENIYIKCIHSNYISWRLVLKEYQNSIEKN